MLSYKILMADHLRPFSDFFARFNSKMVVVWKKRVGDKFGREKP